MQLFASILPAILVLATAASAAERPPLVHVKGPAGGYLTSASYFHDGLVKVSYRRASGGYREGFLDANGKWAVAARYEDAGDFCREGLVRVKEDGRWRYLDRTGAPKIDGKWAWAFDFSQGRAAVVTPGVLGFFQKYGYIDASGKTVIAPAYEFASEFKDGVAWVKNGEKFGLIGLAGEVILPVEYDWVRTVGDGLVEVRKDGKEWFADARGRRAIAADIGLGFFDGGFGVVALPGDPPDLRVIVDREGRPQGAKHRGLGNEIREGLVEFHEGEKYGYKRTDGTTAIKPTFDAAMMFSDGLAAVKVGAKWGYVDHSGTLVIPPRFDAAGRFKEHLAGVREGTRAGFIDRAGGFRLDLGESKTFWAF